MKQNEKRIVMAVFESISYMPYKEQNKILGSETIKEMNNLYNHLKYEDYCKRHHIKYEDMTDIDFEMYHAEKEWEQMHSADDDGIDYDYNPEIDYIWG